MSEVELENVKKENEKLRSQMISNSQGLQQTLNQLEAYKGELADTRTICFQLRLNLGMSQTMNKGLEVQVKNLQAQLEEMKANKSTDGKPNNLEGKPNKS